ncbi:hypothetical protein AOL_s00078g419 [Orbilia oligospora ATCC 24927]|uniref:Uncharacterized protein n=1 Tax=Arthrobotrys oligospora (strain ATCC 24927 / CBS 115.81 / DSM 1491) TaxID=756982 RepID=G1XBX2_ARTOA|nr:hypothetical protein AOL_s00078g419 [Orbilia oligospora ATCC 24927]EGX49386.1 hypothetical protein AOL_s00078g419 [Orbilia oligospora ATCC 24927]
MAPQLLTLPNEILDEAIRHLTPEFATDAEFASHKVWRSSPHQNDLCNLMLTCKRLSAIVRPYLYSTVVLDYHTNMTHLLRTLIENPDFRGLIRTLSIHCPLTFCDSIVDPYSPRETFLDDNPELKRKLNMKWDTDEMDDFGGKVFRAVGLDAHQFKEFTEDEIESLNDNTYWLAVPTYSERIGYENAIMQGMALALIALSVRVERLCLWRFYDSGNMCDFERGVRTLVDSEMLRDKILTGLKRLEILGYSGSSIEDHFDQLLELPAVKELVENGEYQYEEDDDTEFWAVKAQ